VILALLLCLQAWAGPALQEKWTFKVDGVPRAVFFEAENGRVLVSVEDGASARLDQLDLQGQLKKKGIAQAEGMAGPLRAHFGEIYWVAGRKILKITGGKQQPVAEVPATCRAVSDLTVTRQGKILLGCRGGQVLAFEPGVKLPAAGKPVTGLFLLDSVLYVLRGEKLGPFDLEGKALAGRKLGGNPCYGLERSSAGNWISVCRNTVMEFGPKKARVLLPAEGELGRIGYIYDREPKNDLLLVPFTSAREIRAYKFLR
jgi:hypothetical protein